jgi:hypothetical protein
LLIFLPFANDHAFFSMIRAEIRDHAWGVQGRRDSSSEHDGFRAVLSLKAEPALLFSVVATPGMCTGLSLLFGSMPVSVCPVLIFNWVG